MDVKANLHPCAHCECTGTCRKGENGGSCGSCVKLNDLKGIGHFGLPCGVCHGIGHAEPRTERLNKRIAPILALVTVYFLLIGVFAAALTQSSYFSEILAFAAPLIGVILAFYFTARSSQPT
ncbi:molecular chaperone DnaJ [Pseudomonas kermanshahensis]|uniref:molecular chaperone DnaJ n=1 Tax=Pseudomonas TaxID=286 RepID=UPI001645F2FC|nr:MULTISPECIES: molecular chaperone DnaJ [Pseudomonas]MBC3489168.1 molecular chaperone DnaJ [Pseudomonas sp. SWRI50]WEL56204.1 molecular chaperone DnaJ [Pseudomonas kermanshahensis]